MNNKIFFTIVAVAGLHLASNAYAGGPAFHLEDAHGNSVTIERKSPSDASPEMALPQLTVFQRIARVLTDWGTGASGTSVASSGSSTSGAATPPPEQAEAGRSPLPCSITAEGTGRMKNVIIKVTANTPYAGEATFEASTRGRSVGDFSSTKTISLNAGDTDTVKLVTTNLANDARLAGRVLVSGREMRCN